MKNGPECSGPSVGDTGLEPVTSSVSYWRASQLRQSPVRVPLYPRPARRQPVEPSATSGTENLGQEPPRITISTRRLSCLLPRGREGPKVAE